MKGRTLSELNEVSFDKYSKGHERGSGDGITEYTYQLYNKLNKINSVESIYSLDQSKRNNVSGLLKANLEMRNKISRVKCEYDLFHVTNQEAGFVSKMLKKRCDEPVVTTIHDISRFRPELHRVGMLQRAYDRMVRSYVRDAVMRSDFLIFDSKLTMEEVRKKFGGDTQGKVVNIGVKDALINKPKYQKKEQQI